VGDILPVPSNEVGAARELYLARHENSRNWVDFKDFGFFRLEPLDIYYVGGFGVMGWVTAKDYASADIDPLTAAGPGIIAHMNADHVASMTLLAKAHGGFEAETTSMTSVDRLGFYLRMKTADGMRGMRINFVREVHDAGEARTALVEMVRAAQTGA
jgi:putative heme iron utilization protein